MASIRPRHRHRGSPPRRAGPLPPPWGSFNSATASPPWITWIALMAKVALFKVGFNSATASPPWITIKFWRKRKGPERLQFGHGIATVDHAKAAPA